jgi:PAS domain S-box-containing protein
VSGPAHFFRFSPTFHDLPLRTLFEFAPDAIVVSDCDERIQQVNAQATTLFGYPREELIGERIELLLPECFRGRHVHHREGFTAHPESRPMGGGLELSGRRKDGSEFPLDILLRPVETEARPVVLAVVRDITERERIEQALREKNVELERAVEAKDQFLASMSHELRTPLNAILGFTGTLLMKLPGPLNIDQDKQLRTVQTSAKHLLSLINDLLDLAKIKSGCVELRVEPLDCGAAVREVAATLRPLAKNKGVELNAITPMEAVILATDRRALSQILLNLASNALKFTETGSISLEIRRRMEGGAGVVEFIVSDTGIGIREEDVPRLFAAFVQLDNSSTRRYEGTGLGLHLSQKLAELIGGVISVESEPQQGSRFTLTLRP